MKQWTNELSHFDLSDLITKFSILSFTTITKVHLYLCNHLHTCIGCMILLYQCKMQGYENILCMIARFVKACWSHKNHTTTIFTLSHLKHYNITYIGIIIMNSIHNNAYMEWPFSTQGNMCMDIDKWGRLKICTWYALGIKTWWSNCANLWLILNYCNNEGNFVPKFSLQNIHMVFLVRQKKSNKNQWPESWWCWLIHDTLNYDWVN
jgi:hypothetical protein